MAIHNYICHDPFTITCVMYINDYMPCFEFLYILQGDITHGLKCVMYITYHVCYAFLFLFLFIYFFMVNDFMHFITCS